MVPRTVNRECADQNAVADAVAWKIRQTALAIALARKGCPFYTIKFILDSMEQEWPSSTPIDYNPIGYCINCDRILTETTEVRLRCRHCHGDLIHSSGWVYHNAVTNALFGLLPEDKNYYLTRALKRLQDYETSIKFRET